MIPLPSLVVQNMLFLDAKNTACPALFSPPALTPLPLAPVALSVLSTLHLTLVHSYSAPALLDPSRGKLPGSLPLRIQSCPRLIEQLHFPHRLPSFTRLNLPPSLSVQGLTAFKVKTNKFWFDFLPPVSALYLGADLDGSHPPLTTTPTGSLSQL